MNFPTQNSELKTESMNEDQPGALNRLQWSRRIALSRREREDEMRSEPPANPILPQAGVAPSNHLPEQPQPAHLKLVPTLTDLPLVSTVSPDWATEIRRAWAESGARILELACVVRSARERLPRGGWSQLWLDGNMPFSKRKAEMLVMIGRRLNWVTAQTFAHLPQGWSILNCLCALERSDLERLIEAGAIHPGLRLCEAKELVDQVLGRRPPLNPGHPGVSTQLQKFVSFVESTLSLWSPGQRQLAETTLLQILLQIEGSTSAPATAKHAILTEN